MRRYPLVLSLPLVALLVGAPSPTDPRAAHADAAELFAPGSISTSLDELNAAFTPDGKELYYSLNTIDNGMGVILISRLEKGKWAAPAVAPFSGQYSDYDPFIAPDGKKLFFISNRPKGAGPPNSGDFDIYVVERVAGSWGEPRNLGAPINTERPEYYPSVAADGTLYFSTIGDGAGGRFDLFRSRPVDGKYTQPESLGPEVNDRSSEIDSYIAPDQSYIIFASYGRPDELGNGDLYISHNENGRWSPAKNLGPLVNSSAREYCPMGSPDGKYFYWTSKRGFADRPLSRPLTIGELRDSLSSVRNGGGNTYRVPLAAVLAIR